MEYLMTYGWAILIIAVVLGALFQLGVFNSSSFAPRAPPGACQVFRPGGPGTVTNINLMGVCTGQLPQYIGVFNGAGYINAPSSTKWYSDSLTVSLWFQAYAWGRILIGTSPSGVYNWMLYNAGMPQGLGFVTYYTNNVGGGTFLLPEYSNFQLNTWYHVVMVRSFSGSTVTAQIYVNGVSKVTSTANNFQSWTQDTAQPLRIGSTPTTSNNWNGLIANVQIYNTSLSANEIQALYIGGMGTPPLVLQNMVGWWPLNGNANDYSGNNNNGVPTAVTFTSQYGK